MARRTVPALSTALTVLRAIRGWSAAELAAAAGVRRSSIVDYEGGRKLPSLPTLQRLVAVLGFPPRAQPAGGWQLAVRHHGGRGRRPVVHRGARQQDRPDHPRGSDHGGRHSHGWELPRARRIILGRDAAPSIA
jgi:transcriptional regulator with XRE-family HTH domain